MITEPTPTPTQWYRIEQIAARTGLTKRTLRYYEAIGLLDAPQRTEGNYRLYTDADLTRLTRICRLKEALGLTLADIKEMIEMEEEREQVRERYTHAHDSAAQHEQVLRATVIAKQQLTLVETKLQTLGELRDELLARLSRLEQIEHETRPTGP